VAWNVETEKPLPPQVPLPTSTERLVPADVFIPGWDPLPLAIDFTIVTSLRRSDASRLTSSARRCFSELMDQAAADKIRRYGALCAKAGWGFQPFIADTFGAIRADARHFIQRLIQTKKERTDGIEASRFAASLWAMLSEAVVSRAAIQIAHASTEIGECAVRTSGSSVLPSSMGIITPTQPNSSALTPVSDALPEPTDVIPIDTDTEAVRSFSPESERGSIPFPHPIQNVVGLPHPPPAPPEQSAGWEDDLLVT